MSLRTLTNAELILMIDNKQNATPFERELAARLDEAMQDLKHEAQRTLALMGNEEGGV